MAGFAAMLFGDSGFRSFGLNALLALFMIELGPAGSAGFAVELFCAALFAVEVLLFGV